MKPLDDDPHAYEVFVQLGGTGKPIQNVGSIRGADPVLAWQAAKAIYTRREDCSLLWVVPRTAIVASESADAIGLGRGSSRRYRLPGYPSSHRRARASALEPEAVLEAG